MKDECIRQVIKDNHNCILWCRARGILFDKTLCDTCSLYKSEVEDQLEKKDW